MSLPVIGWREVLKALRRKRFYPVRQSGSHIIVENGQGLWTSIPKIMRLTDLVMNMSSIKLTGLCQSQTAFHFLIISKY